MSFIDAGPLFGSAKGRDLAFSGQNSINEVTV